MANCKHCGGWAGVANDEHPDCKAKVQAPPRTVSQSEADAMAMAHYLKPIIYGAGWRAGMSAALTLIAIGVAFAIVRFLFSLA